MASTYTLISSQVLASSASSVTFSSIPATYTDLVLRISARADIADTSVNIYTRFNSDSATNYSGILLQGNGSGTASSLQSNQTYLTKGPWAEGTSYTASTFSNDEFYIPSYTASQNKPVGGFGVAENNGTAGHDITYAGLWRNTAAITSITLQPYSGNFVQYSSFYLYGISNA